MPLASSEFSDGADVSISLRERGRGLRAELGVTSRWNEHPHRSPFALLMGCLVDDPRVVRTICGDRCHGFSDLLKEGRKFNEPNEVRGEREQGEA